MSRTHEPIPADWPVQPVPPGTKGADIATDGYCGLSWDDSIVTDYTPAPSARCPFEDFHVYPEDEEQDEQRTCPECGQPLAEGEWAEDDPDVFDASSIEADPMAAQRRGL